MNFTSSRIALLSLALMFSMSATAVPVKAKKATHAHTARNMALKGAGLVGLAYIAYNTIVTNDPVRPRYSTSEQQHFIGGTEVRTNPHYIGRKMQPRLGQK